MPLLGDLVIPELRKRIQPRFFGEIEFYVRVGIQVFSRLKEGARFRGCSL